MKKTYLALLRGINIGGNNKIDMWLLKNACESIGLTAVKTYINTGNVIFTHIKQAEHKIATSLEQMIKEHFNLSIKVLVLTSQVLKTIVKEVPATWQDNKEMKSDVMFLFPEVNNKDILSHPDLATVNDKIDSIHYVPQAILWSVDRALLTKSGKMKLSKKKLYKQVTVRNVNTARKLLTMMEEVE